MIFFLAVLSFGLLVAVFALDVSRFKWKAKTEAAKSDAEFWKKQADNYRTYWLELLDQVNPKRRVVCVACDTPLMNAPGIGPFCPNRQCDRIDDQEG